MDKITSLVTPFCCFIDRVTLRTMANELHSDSGESEDETTPAEDFKNAVYRMHEEDILLSWVKTSADPTKNPLLTYIENGMIKRVELSSFCEECPRFYQDMIAAGKKHGCYTFLCNFVQQHYPEDIYDTPALFTSQLQYLQIAVTHNI